MSIAHGLEWLENKAKKIEKIMEEKIYKREGYRGIMGAIPTRGWMGCLINLLWNWMKPSACKW